MKAGFCFILVTLTVFLSAQEPNEFPLMKNYYISSDQPSSEIPKNNYVIKGYVKMFSSTAPIDGVTVGSHKLEVHTKTDSNGYFHLEVPDTLQDIYFYKKGWNEFIIEDYSFGSQHEVEVTVYMGQSLKKPQKVRKPVIYFYSNKPQDISVKLSTEHNLTFTYPEYDGQWNFRVNEQGSIFINDEQFPYLFWEAETDQLVFQREEDGVVPGQLVKREEIVTFLEKTLDQMGLNRKEKTDFITYWAPELMQAPFVFIQFLNTEAYALHIAKLNILPNPDSMKRVFLLAAPIYDVDNLPKSEPQVFSKFKRIGFTVVEWGGALIDLPEVP